MKGLVAFICTAPAHQLESAPDRLTVHQGQWAFCGFDAHADGHDWSPTGGMSLSDVAARVRPQERRATPAP